MSTRSANRAPAGVWGSRTAMLICGKDRRALEADAMKRIRPLCERSRTFPRVSLLELDGAVLRLARTRGHSPLAESIVAAYSRTGEHAAIWLVLGLAGAAMADGDADRRARWLRGVRIVTGAYACNQAIK